MLKYNKISLDIFKQSAINTLNKYAGCLLIVWWTLSFTATHLPLPEGAPGLPYIDKIVHVTIYAGLAYLLSMWWNKHKPVKTPRLSPSRDTAAGMRTTGIPTDTPKKGNSLKKKRFAAVFIILLIYAAIDEYSQSFVGRNPDIRDAAANTAGILLGLTLFFR